jgi:hypothetical protein
MIKQTKPKKVVKKKVSKRKIYDSQQRYLDSLHYLKSMGNTEKYVTTPDDWYPCYKDQKVKVKITPLHPHIDEPQLWRVWVWGADDDGMEYDTLDLNEAWDKFNKIQNGITHRKLKSMGFITA